VSHWLVSAVLISAGAMNAGQVIIFYPAVVHHPVHRVLCFESHFFHFLPRAFSDLPCKGTEPMLSADKTRRRVFTSYCLAFVPGRVAVIIYVF